MKDSKLPIHEKSGEGFTINLVGMEKAGQKSFMGTLETRLKRAAHLELSPEDWEKVRLGKKEYSKDGDNSYFMVNEEPRILVISFNRRHLNPFDSERNNNHDSYVATLCAYDKKGKLVEKQIIHKRFIGNDYSVCKRLVTRYDPPGCWKGKRVTKPERRYA